MSDVRWTLGGCENDVRGRGPTTKNNALDLRQSIYGHTSHSDYYGLVRLPVSGTTSVGLSVLGREIDTQHWHSNTLPQFWT